MAMDPKAGSLNSIKISTSLVVLKPETELRAKLINLVKQQVRQLM